MRICLLIACLMVTLISADIGKDCTSDTDCGPDECCQILSDFMVVSKRNIAGTCQSYIPEGQSCDIFGKLNGFCSCLPGYACMALQVPIDGVTNAIQTRDLIPPQPGYTYDIKCAKESA
uniref:Prokineticin domain-containing protein n=1 Tax=Arion vulgaris TaxID=1028688 RepID=A0A0B7B0M2_9EUPU